MDNFKLLYNLELITFIHKKIIILIHTNKIIKGIINVMRYY